MSRMICWFSCGAASAAATKLAIDMYDEVHEIDIVRIRVHDEHADNDRFTKDCEEWFGRNIKVIGSEKYGMSVDNVIASTRYMAGASGARCTLELKKNVRKSYQKYGDIHVFGFHSGEAHRVDRVLDAEPDLIISTPLIDRHKTKQDCYNALTGAGIELPAMYKLGYNNNNCVGCLKATGAGYWNKIRRDFPEVFSKRAKQEELLGVALVSVSKSTLRKSSEYSSAIDGVLKEKDSRTLRVPLRFLPSDIGKHTMERIEDCGILCELRS